MRVRNVVVSFGEKNHPWTMRRNVPGFTGLRLSDVYAFVFPREYRIQVLPGTVKVQRVALDKAIDAMRAKYEAVLLESDTRSIIPKGRPIDAHTFGYVIEQLAKASIERRLSNLQLTGYLKTFRADALGSTDMPTPAPGHGVAIDLRVSWTVRRGHEALYRIPLAGMMVTKTE